MATEKVIRRACNGEDDELEQEDQKMEQFFALIRNFQEARNKRKHELRQKEEKAEIKKKQNKMKRADVDHDEQSSWVPTFEWTDFTEEIEFRRPPIIFPSPYNNKQGKKIEAEDDHGLDLKLTL
ncbi:hypothetical protein CCACVL1_22076 [Corchorus capsularis]|uniref:Uncharacterized protein n=1 Tax=Corchorus capsularis TaxID=210143 RepID=A0A1R3H194_COCAP|nr:hypothetical protein CCACVL1_22076 [Corchorus capsularis]